jgi:hypothetical protein
MTSWSNPATSQDSEITKVLGYADSSGFVERVNRGFLFRLPSLPTSSSQRKDRRQRNFPPFRNRVGIETPAVIPQGTPGSRQFPSIAEQRMPRDDRDFLPGGEI